ncbi:(2Fe-2S)-binding protein [Chloroflexota bacterium]
MDEMTPIILKVNGNKHEVRIKPFESLADVLREKLGLTGTNIMCNEGECGACTIVVDGTPVLSCMTLAIESENKDILTIEGLADPVTGELHPLQKTFIDLSGMQCGVCTPGMIMTGKVLLGENPHPTEDEVREAFAGNLCRCGNYKRITECVLSAADIIQGAGND